MRVEAASEEADGIIGEVEDDRFDLLDETSNFRNDVDFKSQLFTAETRSAVLAQRYAAAQQLPPVHLLDKYSFNKDGENTRCQDYYSNPRYFQKWWLELKVKNRREKKQRKKSKRKKHRQEHKDLGGIEAKTTNHRSVDFTQRPDAGVSISSAPPGGAAQPPPPAMGEIDDIDIGNIAPPAGPPPGMGGDDGLPPPPPPEDDDGGAPPPPPADDYDYEDPPPPSGFDDIPAPPGMGGGRPPPPPAATGPIVQVRAPPPPAMDGPPAPPAVGPGGIPPPPTMGGGGIPPPPAMGGVPPPPGGALPPAPGGGLPRPPRVATASMPASSGRDALLAGIRLGTKLKRAAPKKKAKPVGRAAFLAQIKGRKGIKLKKVKAPKKKVAKKAGGAMSDVMAAMKAEIYGMSDSDDDDDDEFSD